MTKYCNLIGSASFCAHNVNMKTVATLPGHHISLERCGLGTRLSAHARGLRYLVCHSLTLGACARVTVLALSLTLGACARVTVLALSVGLSVSSATEISDRFYASTKV